MEECQGLSGAGVSWGGGERGGGLVPWANLKEQQETQKCVKACGMVEMRLCFRQVCVASVWGLIFKE